MNIRQGDMDKMFYNDFEISDAIIMTVKNCITSDATSGMESEVALIIRWLCVYSVWSSNKVTTKVF